MHPKSCPESNYKSGAELKSHMSRITQNTHKTMKKTTLTLVAACLATTAFLSSCSITMPVAATSNPVGSKVGTAKGTVFLHVLAFGADASIKTAAKNGGITKISTVDIKYSDVLGIVQSYETTVTGE